jgi:hypothetical protein
MSLRPKALDMEIPQSDMQAIVLLDDLIHLDAVTTQPIPSAGDIRRMSGTLRRLTQENHLQIVASPRIGKVEIMIEDVRPVLEEGDEDFRIGGLPPMFGWPQSPFSYFSKYFTPQPSGPGGTLNLANDEPRRTSVVKLSNLLQQPVARYRDALITKGDLLQHACYFDFGVHFRGSNKERVAVASEFKNALTFHEERPGQMGITVADIGQPRPARAKLDLA